MVDMPSSDDTILDDPAVLPAAPDLAQEAADAVERAIAPTVGGDELAPHDVALTAVHVPGTPLARVEDEKSSREYEQSVADCTTDTAVEPVEYAGIDTRTPDANYDTRSNIVRP